MDLSGRNLPNIVSLARFHSTHTHSPAKWAHTILKCLIGVNNLWVEHFKMLFEYLYVCVCHLISFHILNCIIFEVVGFWFEWSFFLAGWLTDCELLRTRWRNRDKNAFHWNWWWHFLPVICRFNMDAPVILRPLNYKPHKTLPFIKVKSHLSFAVSILTWTTWKDAWTNLSFPSYSKPDYILATNERINFYLSFSIEYCGSIYENILKNAFVR